MSFLSPTQVEAQLKNNHKELTQNEVTLFR